MVSLRYGVLDALHKHTSVTPAAGAMISIKVLRSKLPKRVSVTPAERQRLVPLTMIAKQKEAWFKAIDETVAQIRAALDEQTE